MFMSKFRFAIMGAGNIANKFCDGVKFVENCEVTAVASRTRSKAEDFARRHQLAAVYDSYEELLKTEKPDCVYIAVTANAHFELCMLCLDYKVPVICEKAMFLNSNDAETVFQRSKELKVFVMEALWSRFLPAIGKAKQWLDEGRIGKPAFLDFGIGFPAPADRNNRYFNPELGGGTAYDIVVYAYGITTHFIKQKIEDIQVSALFADTGVDVVTNTSIRFSDMLASLKATFISGMDEKLVIYGDKGKLVVPFPHFAWEAFLYNSKNEEIEHFLDEKTQNGFQYEIKEVYECIKRGEYESPVMPHEATLQCTVLFDKIMSTRP